MKIAAALPSLLALGLAAAGPLAARADQRKAPPTEEPFATYFKFAGTVRTGAGAQMADFERYLTDEGVAQVRAWPPAAREAASRLLYFINGISDARLVRQSVDGNKGQLEVTLVFDPMGAGAHDEVRASVEMRRLARGWTVVSETLKPPANQPFYADALGKSGWTSSDGVAWTGLRAPGVFPEDVARKAARTQADKARDLQTGDQHAVGDIRTVISAEAAYSASNNGYYDRLECLAAPKTCLPGYPGNGPVFIGAEMASPAARNGYTTRLDAGPAAHEKTAAMSRTSIESYAVWKVPQPGRKGGRTLCGDSSGVICAMPDGSAPLTHGECPKACVPIQ